MVAALVPRAQSGKAVGVGVADGVAEAAAVEPGFGVAEAVGVAVAPP